VVNSGKTLLLNRLTIANGLCDTCNGGGIYNSGTLNVSNSTFSGNSMKRPLVGGIAWGGGIFNLATLNVSNSTFSANGTCTNGCVVYGGGIFNLGTLNVSNSTFSANSAANVNSGLNGGGIYNGATLTVTNSTFSGNSAANGGAIFNEATVHVHNSTVSGNSASNSNGGGVFDNTAGASATRKNSLVANNSGGDCTNSGTLTADTHNLDSDGSCDNATTRTAGQINLQSLANNGGPTQTMALGPTSAAIDAGDDAVCAAAPISGKDQRGINRPIGPHSDIGAYERDIPTQAGPNFVVNSSADTDDGFCDVLGQGIGNKDCTLREAINAA